MAIVRACAGESQIWGSTPSCSSPAACVYPQLPWIQLQVGGGFTIWISGGFREQEIDGFVRKVNNPMVKQRSLSYNFFSCSVLRSQVASSYPVSRHSPSGNHPAFVLSGIFEEANTDAAPGRNRIYFLQEIRRFPIRKKKKGINKNIFGNHCIE